MWSGRFEQGTDPAFEAWQRSFSFDCRLLPYEVAASHAYAEALRGAGALSEQEAAVIHRGLEQVLADPLLDQDSQVEDVHHYVESRLALLIGETALKLHNGRSRNEQIATDLRLFVRGQSAQLAGAAAQLVEALLGQAEAAGDAAMPAYTHAQRAEPVLVAHWLLAYAEMFLRDITRLRDCAERADECPLGSGAVAGTLLKLDRAALAKALGFARVSGNSMDATSDRDFAVEFVQACSMIALHLSRLAEEFILFATQEYGFVRLPEAYSTGSSAMPQKKNPDAIELIRAKCGGVAGNLVALMMTVKGLPLAYNKDLQETQPPLFDAATQTLAALQIAAGFVRSVEFDLPRMRAAATSGGLNAFAAAAFLAAQGMPFRRSHEAVGKAVRRCLELAVELQQLSAEELRGCGIACDAEAFRAQLSLEAVLAAHDVPGGTAPAQVKAALGAVRQRLQALAGAAHAGA